MEGNEMRNEERKTPIVKKPPYINIARLSTDCWEMMEGRGFIVLSTSGSVRVNLAFDISVVVVV